MGELIKMLSTYSIFNNLLPGILFCISINSFTSYNSSLENIILNFFIYYIAGLIISRIGSIIIEPILKKTKIIKYSEYQDYVKASNKDNKIQLFLEINNMYRSLISMLLCFLIVKGYDLFNLHVIKVPVIINYVAIFSILIIILSISYRKQSEYICKRIDAVNKKEE